jgi:D-apionolactonase
MLTPERDVSETRFPRLSNLHSGALTALVHDGFIRNIRYNGREVLRGIYLTIRDEMWNEVHPVYTESHVVQENHYCSVEVRLGYDSPSVGVECLVTIEAQDEGTLSYRFTAKATRECKTNRLGLCILHGSELAGYPIRVEHTNGQATQGTFPDYISAHQPFTDISGLSWMPTDGLEAELRLDGDTFEMEDQRNWSDDSFKTYCTPLRLPKPTVRAVGTQVSQQATLKLRTVALTVASVPSDLNSVSVHDVKSPPPSTVHTEFPTGSNAVAKVLVSRRIRRQLPYIGVTVPSEVCGLKLNCLTSELRISHIYKQLDFATQDWEAVLLQDLTWVENGRLKLALEVDGVENYRDLHRLLELTSKSGVCLPLLLYSDGDAVTSERALGLALNKTDILPQRVGVAGGTRGHYAQLIRSTINEQYVDAVSFAVSPTVHMPDVLSISETLNAQRQMVTDVPRYMKRDVPIHVGPVTLLSRFNADFRISKDNPVTEMDDGLYRSNFYAAWMVGSIDALSQTQVFAITYSYHGVIGESAGAKTSVYQFLSELQPGSCPQMLDTQIMDKDIHCLATQVSGITKVFLANLSATKRTVDVEIETVSSKTVVIHELTTPGTNRQDGTLLGSTVSLCLPGYGITVITANEG